MAVSVFCVPIDTKRNVESFMTINLKQLQNSNVSGHLFFYFLFFCIKTLTVQVFGYKEEVSVNAIFNKLKNR